MPELGTLVLTTEFLADLTRLAGVDQRRVLRALRQLNEDERVPSLHVHPLHGVAEGVWSAAASKSLRITFERLEGNRKRLVGCSHHYGD